MTVSRRTLLIFTAALLLLCGCSSSLRTRPNVTVPPAATAAYSETPASDIVFADADGNELRLFDYLGKPILLQFRPEGHVFSDDELNMLQHAYAACSEDIVFLLIMPALPSPAEPLAQRGLLPLLYLDSEKKAAAVYDAENVPATVFIDADGFIATQAFGSISEDALLFGLKLL